MKNSVISVASVSGFVFGLVGLPIIKILGLMLFCKIILAGGLVYYMVGITILALGILYFCFTELKKKDSPHPIKEKSKVMEFLKGFFTGAVLLVLLLSLYVSNALNELGLDLSSLF